uniref:E3 ubiquitin-protein ligase TRIM69-like isoform X2 n=1 Tax=Pristiophorus japonicus TaxID=55135 RepID=UPI00398F20AE
MASQDPAVSLESAQHCPICGEMMSDPVTLDCGHQFCRACVSLYWEADTQSAFCAKCSVSLQQSEPAGLERRLKNPEGSLDSIERTGSKPFCQEHQEEAKLFCETEGKMICVNCLDRRVESSHTAHNFMLLNEAVEIYKEQLNKLQTLSDSEFTKLRNMLDEKERTLVQELNEEKDDILGRMERNLQEIRDNSKGTQQRLSFIETQLNEPDEVTLLMESPPEEQSEEDYQPNIAEGSLNLGAFKGPTQYRVWRHVMDILNPGCAAPKKKPTS